MNQQFRLLSLFFFSACTTPSAAAWDVFFDSLSESLIGSQEFPVSATASPMPEVFRLKNGELKIRYRYETDEEGMVKRNTLQYRTAFDVSVHLFQDHVRLDFGAGTGSRFTRGWAGMGIGTDEADHGFYLKEFSLTLRPGFEHVELTLGSMSPEYGAGSDYTSFTSNGYITGYRSKVEIGEGEIIVTTGYVGGFDEPSVFSRVDHLRRFNYFQAMVVYALGEMAHASLEYIQFEDQGSARVAVNFDLRKWISFLDSLTLESQFFLDRDFLDHVYAAKTQKKFENFLGQRDLVGTLFYSYRSQAFQGFPLESKVLTGHVLRLKLAFPNFWQPSHSVTLGPFLDWIQRVDDWDEFRVDLGLELKY
jgi:hypothetical protein